MTTRSKFSQAFNRVLRRYRLERGLSQAALSERADIDHAHVGLLERGQRSAGLDIAKQLAGGLGISLATLIADVEKEWDLEPRRGKRG